MSFINFETQNHNLHKLLLKFKESDRMGRNQEMTANFLLITEYSHLNDQTLV